MLYNRPHGMFINMCVLCINNNQCQSKAVKEFLPPSLHYLPQNHDPLCLDGNSDRLFLAFALYKNNLNESCPIWRVSHSLRCSHNLYVSINDFINLKEKHKNQGNLLWHELLKNPNNNNPLKCFKIFEALIDTQIHKLVLQNYIIFVVERSEVRTETYD